jgi:hypothetical protein
MYRLTMIFMLIVPASVTSMSSVKQVQERAKQQQGVRQNAEEVRLVFFPEEKPRDGEKSE